MAQFSRTSGFLALPAELRLMIYNKLLADDDRPHFQRDEPSTDGIPRRAVIVGLPGWEDTTAKHFPVADVCSQLRREALPLWYKSCSLAMYIHQANTEVCRTWVRKLDDAGLQHLSRIELGQWQWWSTPYGNDVCRGNIDIDLYDAGNPVSISHVACGRECSERLRPPSVLGVVTEAVLELELVNGRRRLERVWLLRLLDRIPAAYYKYNDDCQLQGLVYAAETLGTCWLSVDAEW